jgi:hypothetical protein
VSLQIRIDCIVWAHHIIAFDNQFFEASLSLNGRCQPEQGKTEQCGAKRIAVHGGADVMDLPADKATPRLMPVDTGLN